MAVIRKMITLMCFCIPALFYYSSCVSDRTQPQLLTLVEIEPLPRSVQLKKKIKYEPVYSTMRILEITMTNGVQSEIMAKTGNIKTGLEPGVQGDISATNGFEEIIGTFKITGIVNGFVTCKITNLTRKIPANGYIRIQTGQKEIGE